MWSWRSGGGLGKAGGSVRQRTNKTGGLGRVWEGLGRRGGGRAPGLGRAGCPNLNLLKSAKRDGGLEPITHRPAGQMDRARVLVRS